LLRYLDPCGLVVATHDRACRWP